MKKLFKWLLLLVITLALCTTVVLYNPQLVKGPLEGYLSNLAGYSVALDGELEVGIGSQIEVSAKHIAVSSPDWATHKKLLTIGHLNLVLNTASIFEDTVLIEHLVVDDLTLNLETNAEGTGNWLTADKPSSTDDKEGGGKVVVFRSVQASNAVLRYRNGMKDIENVLKILSLSHHQKAGGMLHTTLNGDLNKRLVEYTGTIGPYENLLNGQDVSFDATGHFGELVLKADGFIENLLKPRYPKINLDLQGPNIDEITNMLGIEDLGSGGFSLRAKGAPVNGLYQADINGKIGDISLSASAEVSDISKFEEGDLSVAINGPSLGSFTRVFGIEDWPDKPFSLKGQAERIGRTLNVTELTLNIGGTKLLLDALLTEFPTLDAGRIKLSITGDEITQFHELLGIKGLATGAFSVDGKLDASAEGVELLQVELETSLGSAKISGSLGPGPKYIGTKLDVHLDGSNANSVMLVFGIDMLPEKPFNLNTRIEVAENGLLIERGVLVTIEDERLEAGGFVAFDAGSVGTNIETRLSGNHLASVLRRYVGQIQMPDRPYDLSGRIQILDEGIRLQDMELEYEAIKLKTDGLINLADQLSGSALDFQIDGENLSDLSKFPAIGTTLDVFVRNQPYQLGGRFIIEQNAWKLNAINGLIGETALNFDALISKRPDLDGSTMRFSVNGPDLNKLLLKEGDPGLPNGAFETNAQVLLSDQTLKINDFSFKTENAQGEIDIELGWPIKASDDISFNINIGGNDIRNFLPQTDLFKAELAAFQLSAVGSKRGELIKVEQFDSTIGNLKASLTARVDNELNSNDIEVVIDVQATDVSKLGSLNGEPLPALPLDIKAEFKGNARQFTIRNLVGSLGESHLDGELRVSLNGPKPNFKLTASSDYLDIRPFLKPVEQNDEATDVADETAKPDRLIPATPLPLEALAANDLSIHLDIAELRYRQDSMTNLLLDVELQAGELDMPQFSVDLPRGKLHSSLSIKPTGANNADVKIDFNTEKFVLNLSGLPEEKLDSVPAFDFDFHASGKGSNLQEVAGTLNGSFYVGSEGGSAENVDLSILETFLFDQLFSVIMPKSDKSFDDNHFSCIAANMEITDGLVSTKPALAFTSEKIAVVTKGNVDLKTEKMNLNFNSTPTNALQINPGEMFYPYILITGTLAQPAVGVDPGKAVLHGGAAIATMGISVLAKGLLDRASNAAPICEQMLKNAPQKNQ